MGLVVRTMNARCRLLFVVVLAFSECITAATSKSGCGSQPPSSGKYTFTNQKREREYWLHVPKGYKKDEATPVVLLFHGWGYSGAEWTSGSGSGAVSAAPTADRENFIIVAPTGLADSSLPGNCEKGNGYCSWNGGGTSQSPGPEGPTCNKKKQKDDLCYHDTCTDGCHDICSWSTCNDDTTMVHALVDLIEENLCVDAQRIYVGGESNGGVMTWQMGTDSRAARFAAFVATIGLPHHGYDFLPAVLPMPIMGIWGRKDKTIPPGPIDAKPGDFSESSNHWYYTTARSITQKWARSHGCDISQAPIAYKTSKDGALGLACTAFSSCRKRFDDLDDNSTVQTGAPVVDCRFNGGHIVPAFTPDLMWEFMSKHARVFHSSEPLPSDLD